MQLEICFIIRLDKLLFGYDKGKRMKLKLNTIISLVLLASFLLASCQSNTAVIENTATPEKPTTAATTVKLTDTPTKAPTKTPTIHPTITASATFTGTLSDEESSDNQTSEESTPTATATAMKIADWSSAEFYTSGSLAHWQYFIALKFDGQITGNYYAIVDKNKDYDCEVLPMYPNRLYCDGPQAAFMDFINFQVFNADTDEMVYEERLWIPGSYYVGE